MTNEQWSLIFERLEQDIGDRSGLKKAWEGIDQDVIDREISPTWRRIVEEVLHGE